MMRLTARVPVVVLLLPIVAALVAVCSVAAQDDPNCTLAETAFPRFQWLTFYAWHASNGNWTNMGQSSSLTELAEFHAATGRPSIVEISDVFFQSMNDVNPQLKGLSWRADALERWNSMVPQIQVLVSSGAVMGFNLGDELVWNNVTWHQLNLSSAVVKESFPELWIFYNEGGAPLWGSYTSTTILLSTRLCLRRLTMFRRMTTT